ncbi:MAG: hypothetical protein NZP74_08675 [Anaerolineales bacterium]|nr:hypothetical protein [Anaerolineales bacterium]MDW8277602.1 hypothetical protein [Anaerolineales bacterium]
MATDKPTHPWLNLFATLTGMAAAACAVITMGMAVFLPPATVALTASPARPSTITPAPTPTHTFTPTPTLRPTQAPRVEIISVETLVFETGCQLNLTVQVQGEALAGYFYMQLEADSEAAERVSAEMFLPPGRSSGHVLMLQVDETVSALWFGYEGGESNRLGGLFCPPVP